jgi:hypothetical protein
MTTDINLICHKGYTIKVRNVTAGMKEYIYLEYGIYNRNHSEWAIDHLIPLCMGGSNDKSNLWPLKKYEKWGKNRKDGLERYLCHAICKGDISIEEAQQEISHNWITAYKKYLALKY